MPDSRLRSEVLRIASRLPKGDGTRRDLLAALKGADLRSDIKAVARDWAETLVKVPVEMRREAGDDLFWLLEDMRRDPSMSRLYREIKAKIDDVYYGDRYDDPEEVGEGASAEVIRMGIIGDRAR